jgi:mannose-1-phosphate guanylyltransferase
MLHAVILAGGRGERFWPFSRRIRPKQLLPLLGERTLLEETVDRLVDFVELDHTLILTSETLVHEVRRALATVPSVHVFGEPVARNTAPAVTYAAARLVREDRDAVCVVLPADHMVRPLQTFRSDLARAAELAADRYLVTIGIPPARPETGYGYIEAGEALSAGANTFAVRAFHEKPDSETAERYLASGRHFWNSGMFIWRADALLEAVREVLPELARCVDDLERHWSGEDGGEAARRFYESAPAVSVDVGVMEKARRIAMVRASFEWDDVGAWNAIARLRDCDAEGNVTLGTVVACDTRDSVLIGEGGLVATLGVEGLVVVRTDDVTMVAPRDRAQEVRRLVEAVRARGLEAYE